MNKKQKKLSEKEIIQRMLEDRKVRLAITKESHYLFFHTYFDYYIKCKTAGFQKEMFAMTEDENIKNIIIAAFRGSAKSTIMTMSYPLWSIFGKPQKKFVIIISRRGQQSVVHFKNIKCELKENTLLRKDLGISNIGYDETGSSFIEIEKLNAKIMMTTARASIRGIRNRERRPDLVILDDIENSSPSKNNEKESIYEWFMGEVMPIGDENTIFVVLSNFLDHGSLSMKLKKDIDTRKFDGVFRSYPIIDDNGQISWPGRFPSLKDIERLRKKVPDEAIWMREYALIPNYEILKGIQDVNRFIAEDKNIDQIKIKRDGKRILNRCGYNIKDLSNRNQDGSLLTIYLNSLKTIDIF